MKFINSTPVIKKNRNFESEFGDEADTRMSSGYSRPEPFRLPFVQICKKRV